MQKLKRIRLVIRLDGSIDQYPWALEREENKDEWSVLVGGTSSHPEAAFEAAMGAWDRCHRTGKDGKWVFNPAGCRMT